MSFRVTKLRLVEEKIKLILIKYFFNDIFYYICDKLHLLENKIK